jgi:hypothetical protein
MVNNSSKSPVSNDYYQDYENRPNGEQGDDYLEPAKR